MVRLQRDLSESIRDAIEASYYVSPEAPPARKLSGCGARFNEDPDAF
jgi:hypothetical protein